MREYLKMKIVFDCLKRKPNHSLFANNYANAFHYSSILTLPFKSIILNNDVSKCESTLYDSKDVQKADQSRALMRRQRSIFKYQMEQYPTL